MKVLDFRLETRRLVLHIPAIDDAEDYFNACNDPLIRANLLSWPTSIENAVVWIRAFRKRAEEKKAFICVFKLKETGELVGAMGLNRIDDQHLKARLAFWCAVRHWGKGLTTEAGMGLIQIGFKRLGLERISASCFVDNDASARVLQKLGMKYEYTARHEFIKDGKSIDLNHYAVLRSDRGMHGSENTEGTNR